MELTLSGAVNRAVLIWNDGVRHGATAVTNDNDNSVLTVEGETEGLEQGWSVGFVLDVDVLGAGTSDVSQQNAVADRAVELGEVSLWIRNDRIGDITIGKTSARGASSGANEQDLSGTEVAAYSGVADVGGGFHVRRRNDSGASGLLGVRWGDLIDSLDEPDGNVIAYSTPELGGFSASVLWGEDDIWNVAAGFHSAIQGSYQIAAALAVNESLQGVIDSLPDHRTASGSVSVLHKPTGLSLTLAGGLRSYLKPLPVPEGRSVVPPDPHFFYAKAGWQGAVIPAGLSAVYVEYGRFRDFLAARTDLYASGADGDFGSGLSCAAPGSTCLPSGSAAQVWGMGVVQTVAEAEAQVYLSFRHFDADIELSDGADAGPRMLPLAGLDLIMAGLLIEF